MRRGEIKSISELVRATCREEGLETREIFKEVYQAMAEDEKAE